jgi:hypothetical protein
VFAVSPVSVYDADVGVPTWLYVPEELELRYTLYPMAPVTADQLTVMLVDDAAVAVTSVGVVGFANVTVILQVAVLLPSSVTTVIVADPAALAVTRPFATVATLALLLLHVTFWFVALEGIIVALRVSVLPTLRLIDDLFRETPVTEMFSETTVTLQVAVLPPSTVVTVIVADPAAFAVTRPFATVTTLLLLLLHVTLWLLALDGVITAVRVSVPPTIMFVDAFKETPVTATLVGPLGVVGVVSLPRPESQAAIENPITTSRAVAQSILLCFPKCLNVFFTLKAPSDFSPLGL